MDMDKDYEKLSIRSADTEQTYKTRHMSESDIPLEGISEGKDKATGEAISAENASRALPAAKPSTVDCSDEIDAYIAGKASHLQVLLLDVRMAIRQALPDATEKISWQMPTFWQGRNLIHFAAQKNHLGIYPGEKAIEHFAPRLTGYKTSKGAVQFPYQSFGAQQLALITEIAAWTAAVCQCGRENANT